MSDTYRIVRYYFNRGSRVVYRGFSLEEAQNHCSDPSTSSSTCYSQQAKARTRKYGPWFDGYTKEK